SEMRRAKASVQARQGTIDYVLASDIEAKGQQEFGSAESASSYRDAADLFLAAAESYRGTLNKAPLHLDAHLYAGAHIVDKLKERNTYTVRWLKSSPAYVVVLGDWVTGRWVVICEGAEVRSEGACEGT